MQPHIDHPFVNGSSGLASALNLPAGLVREIADEISAHLNGQPATADSEATAA
ncbi:MAG: hypothetical protein AAFX58_00860 [Pseudomonadota bacterium]